jgi:hypothetical protein
VLLANVWLMDVVAFVQWNVHYSSVRSCSGTEETEGVGGGGEGGEGGEGGGHPGADECLKEVTCC